MKLEQHLYTSRKTEFTTVAITDGLSRDDRLLLEKNSLYILPASLMYQEQIETPIKYVFYPLDAERVVFGNAIYIGKDSLGRPGNYLFHNFIARQDDFLTFFGLNPVTLIRYLERHDLFRTDVPKEACNPVDIAPSPYGSPPLSFPKLRQEALSQVLYICLHHDTVQLPLLTHGQSGDCLDFLERLYPLLPFELRTELSFDTYTYGVHEGFRIQGLPDRPEYHQNLSPSVTLHLAQSQLSVTSEIPPPSKRLTMIHGLIAARNLDMLTRVYELEFELYKGDYEAFIAKFRDVSLDTSNIILDFHRESLLQHIAITHDSELLRLIQHQIGIEDLNRLVDAPEMIHCFLEPERKRHSDVFSEWLCSGKADKTACYPFLFEWLSVWKIFLERVASSPERITDLLPPCRLLPAHYQPEFEELLLDELLAVLPTVAAEKKFAKEFLKILTVLPEPDSEPLTLLRTAVIAGLKKDAAHLTTLLTLDLSSLSEGRQWPVFGILLKGILSTKDSEKMQQQLNDLLQCVQHDQYSLQLLLHVLEELKRPKKARRILNDILGTLSREKLTAEARACVQRLTTPPPSLFQRVKKKFFK